MFSFTGLQDFIQLGLKASIIFLSKILSAFPRNFGDSFNTSYHANCCPETRLCFFARSLASDPRPLMATSVLKTKFFIPISADEESYFRFRVLANHLASFFFLHPVRRFLRATILTSVYPFLYPSGHRVKTSVGFHSDLDLLLRPRGIDLHSLFFF